LKERSQPTQTSKYEGGKIIIFLIMYFDASRSKPRCTRKEDNREAWGSLDSSVIGKVVVRW
jgi:hypothetical protein